jgi:hypothetical protein
MQRSAATLKPKNSSSSPTELDPRQHLVLNQMKRSLTWPFASPRQTRENDLGSVETGWPVATGFWESQPRSVTPGSNLPGPRDRPHSLRSVQGDAGTRTDGSDRDVAARGDTHVDTASRLRDKEALAAEVAALEADEEDRAEMLAIAEIMKRLRATRSSLFDFPKASATNTTAGDLGSSCAI